MRKRRRKKKSLFLIVILLGLVVLITGTILILKLSSPRLVMNGKDKIEITYSSEFKDPGAMVINDKDNEFNKTIETINEVDMDKIGTYYIYYTATINGKKEEIKREVKVIDDIAPIVKLNGEEKINWDYGKEYVDPSLIATDEYDGDVSDRIKVEGMVDVNTMGTYQLTYIVTDKSGNASSIKRTVIVKDQEKPTIKLVGGYAVLKVGDSYSELGYSATDNLDGDLTNKVVVSNKVNNNKEGIYFITYTVKDSSNNESSAKRRVIVYKPSTTKNIYLTFDDGPSFITPQILDVLKQKGVKATFFVSDTGYYTNMTRAHNEGHEIGLHGFHEYKKLYASSQSFFKYFDEMQEVIKKYTGEYAINYRFPGGSNTVYLKLDIFKEIEAEFNQRGIVFYDWNVSAGDATGQYMSKDDIYNTVLNQVVNSSRIENVILMHDMPSKTSTLEALPNIIDTFKSMGYNFKTVSQISNPPQYR